MPYPKGTRDCGGWAPGVAGGWEQCDPKTIPKGANMVKGTAKQGGIIASKIKRVGGAQAEMARSLGLIKIDRPSAKLLYNAGVPLVMVGSNVNSFHFFGGWGLAHHVNTAKASQEKSFDSYANSFGFYLEPELGRGVSFFVASKDLK